MKSVRVWLALALLVSGLASHAMARLTPLPPYVTLPAQVPLADPDQQSFEPYGEAEFYPDPAKDEAVAKQGKHWHVNTSFKGLPDDVERKAIWARLKPAFLKSGWIVSAEYDQAPFSATLHLPKPDAWANISIFGGDDIRMDIVEIGPPGLTLALTAPAATPEKIDPDKGDFPWLKPLPGSKFASGQREDGPMAVTQPGATDPDIVGTGTIVKNYTGPEGLSTLMFATAYRDALAAAGWTVIDVSQGLHQSDAAIVAHYAKNGRDLWAALHGVPGEYSIGVVDIGARDLGGELSKVCHIALYGVLFDFDKATLKPESDSVLSRVQAILAKDASLKVEVQGHTDGVGSDSYNTTLSDARAKSVMAWLTRHGIAAERLTAKGYGKTMPVADNDSDEGRAKNRRVEVARPGCKAK